MKIMNLVNLNKSISSHHKAYSHGLSASMLAIVITACGQYYHVEEDQSATASDSAETEEAYELPYLETLQAGDCGPELGCMRGFISHGMELVLKPDTASLNLVSRTKGVSLEPIMFRDAQDFGDRFDTAFLKPLVPQDELELYEFTISPTVSRDNFAEGFELYTEGLSAVDKSLTMGGEGNFILGDIIPYDRVNFRAVKMLRIEMSKYDAQTDSHVTDIICMEISTTLRDNLVEAENPVNVGGLSEFDFYYTEDSSYCSSVKAGTRPGTKASTLPATLPQIP